MPSQHPDFRRHDPAKRRLRFAEWVVYVVLCLMAVRATIIHMFPPSQDSLKQIASQQYSKTITLGNYRGTIFDRRGTPLALSVKNPSLAVNPKIFSPHPSQQKHLHEILGISRQRIQKITHKNSYFAWLSRHTTLQQAKDVLALSIAGIYPIQEPARYYPTAHVSAHVVGKVDIDNRGILGVERVLETALAGEAGKIIAVRDGHGQPILQHVGQITPEESGKNVHLSIDSVIQEIVSEELQQGIHDAGALSGFVIVGDPYTGAILALSSFPHYNPNQTIENMEHARNKATTDLFEPGSIIKPFVVAEALKRNLTTMDTLYHFDTSGVYRFSGGRIRDDHPKEKLTTHEILAHSSNIGIFYIAEKLGKEALWGALDALGIGRKHPPINGLATQSHSRLSLPKYWRPIRFANVSFGQGFSMTGLDVLRAYNVLASGGKQTPLHLISKITHAKGGLYEYRLLEKAKTLYSPKIIGDINASLRAVITEGTGRLAASNLYTVAGKTGTTEKYDPILKAYSEDKRIASFAGFAPFYDPKITVLVFIDEPSEKPYYGGKWAAPVFAKIIDRVLPYLNVPPDNLHATLESHETHKTHTPSY
ncbi:MAG: penicillin-binding protein 2 [Proteobacteria bacterium]|nr:penicillin-binding protein 2 [Pseudomonadota bacterium]